MMATAQIKKEGPRLRYDIAPPVVKARFFFIISVFAP